MEALIEALKEGLRVVLISVIPIILSGINFANNSSVMVHINWQFVLFAGVVAGLRFIDSFLHEQGKNTNNTTMAGGLTRF